MKDEIQTFKIGIDVGGTFTDLFVWSSDGRVETFKALSTPHDPSIALIDGLSSVAAAHGLTLEELSPHIRSIVHGTTVTTNTVLTRRGAKTGLITTEGVRDGLEMRRGIREEQYNNRFLNVVPLVPRGRRRPVRGRIDAHGAEVTPLDLEDVREAASLFRREGVEAVAICFMNAFANPVHEREAQDAVRAELPEVFLSVSSEVLPTIRFYDRISTTALNAYVGPVLRDYVANLIARLSRIGFQGTLLIMQSSGGVASPGVTLERPAGTLFSGPAAGPKAGHFFSQAHGESSCLVVDMGGTSFDASLVRDGHVALKTAGEVDRLRIALPMLDIDTIGAGGGSIGWIDSGGLMRMGPQSAGADPGPACYGRGGRLPTCTDAQLVLGYLNPEFFAGGKLRLEPELARRAIEEHVARPLRLEIEEAAAGMYRVISSNMAHGVRRITVQRGLDPREFPMVVAGGAGPPHACAIATELEIPTILVPQMASVLCAAGMLMSDLGHDFARSLVSPLDRLDPGQIDSLIGQMVEEGQAQLEKEGVPGDAAVHHVALDLRYLKQYHEVTLPVDRRTVAEGRHEAIAALFHREHNRLYGYDLAAEKTGLELITVRVRSLGLTDKPALPRLADAGADPGSALKGHRDAFVSGWRRFATLPIYDGHELLAGHRIEGPALIERTDTTILIDASYRAEIDHLGTCLMRRATSGCPGGPA